jgi:hypothetical protein
MEGVVLLHSRILGPPGLPRELFSGVFMYINR